MVNGILATLALLLSTDFTASFLFGSTRFPPWDHLSVTWGKFSGLPNNENAAKNNNWKLIEDGCQTIAGTCGGLQALIVCSVNVRPPPIPLFPGWKLLVTEKGPFVGKRYVKSDDYTTVLLFTVNGDVAGIQMGIPENTPVSKTLRPPFIPHQGRLYLTAMFIPVADICSKQVPVDKDYLGSKLLIQMSGNATTMMEIPLREHDLASTNWVKGKCFWAMGQHYWYNISPAMDCDNFFPAFLLYNKGYLNGFGWALRADIDSPRVEHPTKDVLGYFFHGHTQPACLHTNKTLSTQHIYLESYAALNRC